MSHRRCGGRRWLPPIHMYHIWLSAISQPNPADNWPRARGYKPAYKGSPNKSGSSTPIPSSHPLEYQLLQSFLFLYLPQPSSVHSHQQSYLLSLSVSDPQYYRPQCSSPLQSVYTKSSDPVLLILVNVLQLESQLGNWVGDCRSQAVIAGTWFEDRTR